MGYYLLFYKRLDKFQISHVYLILKKKFFFCLKLFFLIILRIKTINYLPSCFSFEIIYSKYIFTFRLQNYTFSSLVLESVVIFFFCGNSHFIIKHQYKIPHFFYLPFYFVYLPIYFCFLSMLIFSVYKLIHFFYFFDWLCVYKLIHFFYFFDCV